MPSNATRVESVTLIETPHPVNGIAPQLAHVKLYNSPILAEYVSDNTIALRT